METITLTVEKSLLEDAKKIAEAKHTTLDAMMKEWLSTLSTEAGRAEAPEEITGAERVRRYDELMKRLHYVKAAGPYTREEMNER